MRSHIELGLGFLELSVTYGKKLMSSILQTSLQVLSDIFDKYNINHTNKRSPVYLTLEIITQKNTVV